jgi:hypothetical protein
VKFAKTYGFLWAVALPGQLGTHGTFSGIASAEVGLPPPWGCILRKTKETPRLSPVFPRFSRNFMNSRNDCHGEVREVMRFEELAIGNCLALMKPKGKQGGTFS